MASDIDSALAPSPASIYLRLKAGLVDWFYCGLFYFAFSILGLQDNSTGTFLISLLLSLTTIGLYFSLFEASASGATPGKRRYQLRVTDLHGNRLTYRQAVKRFGGKLLILASGLLPMLVACFNVNKRALDDLLSDSMVCSVAPRTNGAVGAASPTSAGPITGPISGPITGPINEPFAATSAGSVGATNSATVTSIEMPSAGNWLKRTALNVSVFGAVAVLTFYLASGRWSMPPDPVPAMFPVILAKQTPAGPEFRTVDWYALKDELSKSPEESVSLPAGRTSIDKSAQTGDTDVLSFSVSNQANGEKTVSLSYRDGSKALEASYRIKGDEVIPEKMHLWNVMSILAALVVGAIASKLFSWINQQAASDKAP